MPRPTGRVDRHPSAVLPGSTNEWRVQNPLAGGTELTFCSLFPPVPANLEPRQTVEPLETDMVSMERDGLTPLVAWFLRNLPQFRRCGLKKGGRVVGCEHPGRSQKPHEKRRNCLPHPPMLSRRLVAGARPRSRQMAGMCVGRGPGSRRHPCCPHSPHCVAAGCWLLAADLDARYLGAVPSSTQTRPRHLPTDGARRWVVMDTRSRLALQDDGWAGTEGPSFCAPLALYGALLRSPPAQGTCMISTQTGYGVPNGDPWG